MRRCSIWYLDADGVHWFAFTDVDDGVHIAKRLNVMFGVVAIVTEYFYEPPVWQRRPHYRMRQGRVVQGGARC